MTYSNADEPDYTAMGTRLMVAVRAKKSRDRTKRLAATVTAAATGVALLAGSFWYFQSDYERRYSAECFSAPSLSADAVKTYLIPEDSDVDTGGRIELATEACAASWRAGVIGQPRDTQLENKYPVPVLQVCEDRWGILKVLPSADPGICGRLKLSEASE